MLWYAMARTLIYRSWLETRWRLMVVLGFMALLLDRKSVV